MVGHTGNWSAALKASNVIDEILSRLEKSVIETDSQLFITADHGNIEYMFDDKKNQLHTAHTTNPVAFLYIAKNCQGFKLSDGKLADIAPTILSAMNIEIPAEMTGNNLIEPLEVKDNQDKFEMSS